MKMATALSNQNTESIKKFSNLFLNKTFKLKNFDECELDEVENIIKKMGGIVTSRNKLIDDELLSDEVNYVLDFNMVTSEPIDFDNTVTTYWLNDCIRLEKQLNLDEHPLYQPIPKLNGHGDKVLTGCIISTCGYKTEEKRAILELCKTFGAITQPLVSSRKTKSAFENTHLICKDKTSRTAYNTAKMTKIPTVSINWLVDTIMHGKLADVEENLIENLTKFKNQRFMNHLYYMRDRMSTRKNDTNEEDDLTAPTVYELENIATHTNSMESRDNKRATIYAEDLNHDENNNETNEAAASMMVIYTANVTTQVNVYSSTPEIIENSFNDEATLVETYNNNNDVVLPSNENSTLKTANNDEIDAVSIESASQKLKFEYRSADYDVILTQHLNNQNWFFNCLSKMTENINRTKK